MADTAYLPGAAEAGAIDRAIGQVADPAGLLDCAAAIRGLAAKLNGDGLGAEAVTRLVSLLNDRLVVRCIDFAAERARMPAAAWCWIGLGSEGRMEQTLCTDQDNGLIFAASDAREARELREHFLPFAREMNRILAACGFPLCDGDVMAGNPRWCLSLEEWKDCFSAWIRTPEPDALLNATIFFDFRPLAGQQALAEALRAALTAMARGNDIFLRMMTENALKAVPPLGRIKDFAVEGGSLDLKKSGSRLFVDAARILALAEGVPSASTLERLRGAARAGALRGEEAESACRAFLAIQGLRLDGQCGTPAGENDVDPEHLGEFDRAVLLAALRQARNLQRMLKARYHIEN